MRNKINTYFLAVIIMIPVLLCAFTFYSASTSTITGVISSLGVEEEVEETSEDEAENHNQNNFLVYCHYVTSVSNKYALFCDYSNLVHEVLEVIASNETPPPEMV